VLRRRDNTDDDAWGYRAHMNLREHDLPVRPFGLSRRKTEALLDRAAYTIERLEHALTDYRTARDRWRQERTELQAELDELRTRAERLLGEAMIDAHKAGQVVRTEAEVEAETLRTEAEAVLEAARQDAQRLLAEARAEAEELVAEAEAGCERLAAQGEQYKLLAADVQRRAVLALQGALETLGDGPDVADASDEVTPFRQEQHPAAAE
jgi:cell division septum initiation protein DivIVA